MQISEICAYLKNWFDKDADDQSLPSWRGSFVITGGELVGFADKLLNGQYFRIQNSLLNDGVYKYPATGLNNETFEGKIQAMAIPPELVAIFGEISAWMEKYGSADSMAMSPFNAESFAGYSYSKASGGISDNSSGDSPIWAAAFAGRISRWRKL